MLSNDQLKILKYLYNNNQCALKDLEVYFGFNESSDKCLRQLSLNGYVSRIYVNNTKCYSITHNGKAYVEKVASTSAETKFSHTHIWVNSVIAVMALLTAISALVVSIMQLLQGLGR